MLVNTRAFNLIRDCKKEGIAIDKRIILVSSVDQPLFNIMSKTTKNKLGFIIDSSKFYNGVWNRYWNNLAFSNRYHQMDGDPFDDEEEKTLEELMKPFMKAITYYWPTIINNEVVSSKNGTYEWSKEEYMEHLKFFLDCKAIRFFKNEDQAWEDSELLTLKKCEKMKLI